METFAENYVKTLMKISVEPFVKIFEECFVKTSDEFSEENFLETFGDFRANLCGQ